MLSLWANWLQLNSQLNSSGVSFCLYRTFHPKELKEKISENEMHEFFFMLTVPFNVCMAGKY